MQTLKIKYKTSSTEDLNIIKEYQKQYSSCLHYVYNRTLENISQKEIKERVKHLSNISLLDSWFIQSSIFDAKTLSQSDDKIIFGGKKNFFNRLKGKISKYEYKSKRLSPIYSIGEVVNKSVKSNRKFHIEQDLDVITFKPNKSTKVELNLIGLGNRKLILSKLYEKQERKEIKITYKLDSEYVYISFDEIELYFYKNDNQIQNRIMSIDLNPNYIGYSIIDWKSSSEFKVIHSGVYSIKELNDKDFELKGKGFNSSSKERKFLSDKRQHEILEISKNLINKAIYYKCSIFSMEDLSIKSSDKENGKHFNKLINNLWCRNLLLNNLTKRCNIFKIKLLKVKPEYSSFIGNFLFRSLNIPDMILSSIEISRRAYEFYNQYVIKTKNIKKNIVQPLVSDFKDLIIKSLEEFNNNEKFESLIDIYYFYKKMKLKYRLSLDDKRLDHLKFSRFFSNNSLICCI